MAHYSDMFSSVITDSKLPFIQHIDMGWINYFPSLRYCIVKFNVNHYQDNLYEEFGIPFPEQLSVAVAKRRAEYLAVRYAAQRVLLAGGCDGIPTMASDRSPVWPAGWCGSLSHTFEYAVAVVSPSESNFTPGIDIELLSPEIVQKTGHIFAQPDELEFLANSDIDYATALLITFSAKESLFKALYPEVCYYFYFDAAKICRINPVSQKVTLELTRTLTSKRVKGSKVNCYYDIADGRVITLIV